MARRTAGRKAHRVLDFITGLEDPEVRAVLSRHGFGDKDLDAGWQHLRSLGRARRAAPPAAGAAWNAIQQGLDEWENRWFVICEAALAANHPKVGSWLFRKLSRQRGDAVVLSVHLLIDRVRQLERGVPKLGSEAKAARALLRRRGLTDKTLAEADRLLSAAKSMQPATRSEPPQSVEDAEAAMWAWYLEWSAIARAVLDEPRLLSHLSLGKPGRPRK